MPKRVKTTEDMSKEAALVWDRHVLISAGKFEGGTPYPPLLNPEPAKEEPAMNTVGTDVQQAKEGEGE